MENFPTPKLALVPRIANLLTLVFLAGTTWWSSAQRPLSLDTVAPLSPPAAQHAANKPSQLPVDNPAPVARPAVTGDTLITVGFSGASLR